MTKMVATVAALQLMERGELDFDAPIEAYCPEWADLQVLEGFDGDTPRLRPPAIEGDREAARHPHRRASPTGSGTRTSSAGRRATGTPNVLSGDNVIFTAPLVADPGTTFEYGINTDWLGKVDRGREREHARRRDRREHHRPARDDRDRVPDDARAARELGPGPPQGRGRRVGASDIELRQDPEYWAGGHGLHSTPRDYLKFQRALLGDGTSPDGVKILEKATVDAAFTNQIGDLDFPAEIPTADPASTMRSTPARASSGATACCSTPRTCPGARRAWSGAWAGLLNTHFWVDRTAGVDRGDLHAVPALRHRRRRCRCTRTSSGRCTRRSEPDDQLTRSARNSSHVRRPTARSGARFAPERNARAALPGSRTRTIGRRLRAARR